MFPERMNRISIISFIIFVSIEKTAGDGLVVQLPEGAIRGRSRISANGSEYYAFQEIPFASPPTGNNRFQVPKPPQAWSGIRDATTNTKACLQSSKSISYDISSDSSQSEDCLYLNVYTPVKPGTNISLPVFIFIHGGAYVSENSWYSSFGPKYLIDHDVVIVTTDYRLGVLGFLSTKDGVIPGNLGLKDQQLALEWVQKNIHLFGGDHRKVAVGGISAGSSSVGYHLLSKRNKGLFRAVILESGTAINTWGYQRNPENYAFQVGNILDNTLSFKNTSNLLSVLLKASANDIIKAASQVPNDDNQYGIPTGDLLWCPTIEETGFGTEFISDPMYDSLDKGKFNQVPILIGFTSEEAIRFMGGVTDKFSKLYDDNPSLLVNDKFHLNDNDKDIVGRKLRELYTNNSSFVKDIGGLIRFSSDNFMTRSVSRHAVLTSRYVPTYLYKFSYGGTPSEYPDTERVAHSQETRFIWEKTISPDTNDFDNVIRQRILKMWTNFIKYLDPTPSEDPLLLNTIWPKVKPDNVRYLNIDESFTVGSNPRQYNEVSKIIDEYVHYSPLATY